MAFSNDFMAMFGLHVPILQAPIASCATLDLVRAVGQAGGMGSLALTELPPTQCEQNIAALNALHLPYFVNYVLRFGTGTAREVAAMQPPCITLSWGLDPALVSDIRRKGVKVGIMVGSVNGATAAVAAGADFLILQGMEAGGHVQASRPLTKMLSAVVALAGTVPVVAAGGIADGADIAAAMNAGAQAVMLGTRYLATAESLAHAQYKQALVGAKSGDRALSNCFDIGWPYAMHGVLRNETLELWEAAGCPAAPDRPNESEIILRNGDATVVRYSDTAPVQGLVGNAMAACLYAGTGVDRIDRIEAAGPLTTRLWSEARTLMLVT